MNIIPTEIPDILIIEPRIFSDHRGFFFESFNEAAFVEKTGLQVRFVQDNHSCSARNVLRGLHYQVQQAQGKLVRVISGAIFDVAVDLRKSSPTFGQWVSCELTAENRRQLWIPAGFAHGFLALSDQTEVLYKTTDYYSPAGERCLLWEDPDLDIAWPLTEEPILTAKDLAGLPLRTAATFE